MIRITVDVVPFGDERLTKRLGVMKIWNTLSGSLNSGSYRYAISNDGKRVLVEGGLDGFPRRRLGPWDLLLRALHDAYAERNNL